MRPIKNTLQRSNRQSVTPEDGDGLVTGGDRQRASAMAGKELAPDMGPLTL